MSLTSGEVIRSPRIADRRRAVRLQQRSRRRRLVIAFALVVAAGAGAVLLTRSEVFQLDSIAVVGTRTVTDDTVREASGLAPGQNLLSIDLGAVEARVEELPAVLEARVTRDGSLGIVIEIAEREAVLGVRAGERRWFVDAEGRVVPAPDSGVPVVDVGGDVAGPVTLDAAVVDGVVTLWRALPKRLRGRMSPIGTAPGGDLSFSVAGTAVRFGTLTHVKAKVHAFLRVRRRVLHAGDDLDAVDVSSPRRPAASIS
ncbi:MAG TPA: FtsQ-type POTRA domain-containing protein [Actinomycetota bacterium]